jgi:hypothetical protein
MCFARYVASIAITMPTTSIGQAANTRTKLGCEVHSLSTLRHNTNFTYTDLGYTNGR